MPDVRYQHDAFGQPKRLSSDGFGNIGDYLLFVRKLETASDDDLLIDYPDLDTGVERELGKVIKMHRDWAREVSGIVKQYPKLNALY